MQVVITEFMDEAALTAFGEAFKVTFDPTLVDDRARLLTAIRGADAVIVRNRTVVDAEFLAAAPDLKVVGRLGVGLDNIDLSACAARGVTVCPATGANTVSVAEYVIAAAMILTRGAYHSEAAMVAGNWPRSALGAGGEVSGRHLGLLGFGAIGEAVAARAAALGLLVSAHDPHRPPSDPAWQSVARVSFDALIASSDIVSLHVPLTAETRGLFDAATLARMKPGAILINTARGGLIEEAALVSALQEGHLGGAALDVFEAEPLTGPAAAAFSGVKNLLLTPHIAGVTAEANGRVSHLTVRNVIAALGGGA